MSKTAETLRKYRIYGCSRAGNGKLAVESEIGEGTVVIADAKLLPHTLNNGASLMRAQN